jgi:hypothetical protein
MLTSDDPIPPEIQKIEQSEPDPVSTILQRAPKKGKKSNKTRASCNGRTQKFHMLDIDSMTIRVLK